MAPWSNLKEPRGAYFSLAPSDIMWVEAAAHIKTRGRGISQRAHPKSCAQRKGRHGMWDWRGGKGEDDRVKISSLSETGGSKSITTFETLHRCCAVEKWLSVKQNSPSLANQPQGPAHLSSTWPRATGLLLAAWNWELHVRAAARASRDVAAGSLSLSLSPSPPLPSPALHPSPAVCRQPP